MLEGSEQRHVRLDGQGTPRVADVRAPKRALHGVVHVADHLGGEPVAGQLRLVLGEGAVQDRLLRLEPPHHLRPGNLVLHVHLGQRHG